MAAGETASLLRLAARLSGLPVAILARAEGAATRVVAIQGAAPEAAGELEPLLGDLIAGRREGLIPLPDARGEKGCPADPLATRLRHAGLAAAVVAPLAEPDGTVREVLCCLGPPGVAPASGAAQALADLAGLGAQAARSNEAVRRAETDEARLRAAIDSIPHPFWITDAEGRYVLQNAVDRAAYGDLVGLRVEQSGMAPEIIQEWRDRHRRVLAGETIRFVGSKKIGAREIIAERLIAPLVVDGAIVGQVGLALDVTARVQTERQLAESEARLQAAVDALPFPFFICDNDGRHILQNARDRELWGDGIGKTFAELGLPAEISAGLSAALERMRAGEPWRNIVCHQRDGRLHHVEEVYAPVLAHGSMTGFVGLAIDHTDRKLAEAALREAHARLEALAASDLIGITAGRGWRVEEGNDAFLRMLGRDRAELEAGSLDWRELTVDGGSLAIEQADGPATVGPLMAVEQELVRVDGARVPVLLNRVVLDAADGRWFALVHDLTSVKAAEQRIRLLAERDGLTGLANRHVLLERLKGDLGNRRRPGGLGALMMLDLDRFKEVNDRLGHGAGDALLRTVGERLTSVLRDTDTIARLGGDEFAMVLRDLQGPAAVADLAGKLLDVLGEPMVLEGQILQPRCSIGISLFPRDGTDVMRLLKNADIALYQAKAKGRGRFCFFEPALLEALERRRAIGEALQAGIAEHAFEIELQPQIHLASGCHAGFEALVRWRRDGELVAPGEFIGIAEEIGVIAALGRLVLRQALEALRRCDELALEPGHVAVNIAAAQLKAPGFPAEVAALLEELGLEAHRLEIEVTEGVLLDRDADAIAASLRALHRLGTIITLDDFGTGAASLTHLKTFPVDRLKIDRSFVRDIGRDPGDAEIVRTIINLAHTLGMTVIAEGVETAEQEAYLELHACDLAQGFRFARPMPVAGLVAYLAPIGVLAG